MKMKQHHWYCIGIAAITMGAACEPLDIRFKYKL